MADTVDFESGHQDRVTVLHVNFDGTRILTASADHRVKVWDRDPDIGTRTLVDTWTAHDADIRDAKWLHPTTGSHMVTIGNDLCCKIWTEDSSQPPNSGRRFRKITQIDSTTRVPFVSLDLKNIDLVYTYLALIDRQGLISVYEPTNPDEFKEWMLTDQWHACQPPPGRDQETSFRVRFDPNPISLPWISGVSAEKSMLGVVATAMNEVKMYRAVSQNTAVNGDSSRPMTFIEAAALPAHPALVRDVQWAPFNVRGSDLIATACRDGGVRIFEINVTKLEDDKARLPNSARSNSTAKAVSQNQRPPQQSSLTNAITGRGGNLGEPQLVSGASNLARQRPQLRPPFKQTVKQMAELDHVHKDAWTVAWDSHGQILLSTGSEGLSKMWKNSTLKGEWLLFADQGFTVDEGSGGEDDTV